MTFDLALDARNFLAQQPSVTTQLGSDSKWDTWIFSDSPFVRIENTSKVMIVITINDDWSPANDYNTTSFPRMIVDVWADPSRNSDHSVLKQDAKAKIASVYKAVDKYFHTVNNDTSSGGSVYWGTAAQIAAKTGTRIAKSVRLDGYPKMSPVSDGNGAFLGSVVYGLII